MIKHSRTLQCNICHATGPTRDSAYNARSIGKIIGWTRWRFRDLCPSCSEVRKAQVDPDYYV